MVPEQPCGVQPGPSAPEQPSNGSLITRHCRGMEALANRRQSPRRYHRNNPYPPQASKGFVRVPVCAFLSPTPPVVVFCVFVCEKRGAFFSSPGSVWHQGLDNVKSERGRDGQTDGAKENQENQPQGWGGFGRGRVGGVGGRGSCGANEEKINIYMGRVLKPYFASL